MNHIIDRAVARQVPDIFAQFKCIQSIAKCSCNFVPYMALAVREKVVVNERSQLSAILHKSLFISGWLVGLFSSHSNQFNRIISTSIETFD